MSLESEIARHLNHLFPIRRSLTGDGNRETLAYLEEITPLRVFEVPSGSEVFDWVVPQEWRAREAWIEDAEGNRWVDFRENPLHLLNYSIAIDRTIGWEELKENLFVHPELPNAIPYRTSYYEQRWGFCLSQQQRKRMDSAKGPFRVVIDSEHFDGSLSYGEILLPGATKREILISSYICHPHMANDGVSGMLLTAMLARSIAAMPARKWSYRIIFIPETIGAITYCQRNPVAIRELAAGLEITTAGGPGHFGLKKSWNETHWINDLLRNVLDETGAPWKEYPFDIHGADERQFSSQAFRVNVATVSKDRYHTYPEYHSSADDLNFVTAAHLNESLELYLQVVKKLEELRFFRNKQPNCEVMLSKHDLYPALGGASKPTPGEPSRIASVLWLLFYLDGNTPLSSISNWTGIPLAALEDALGELVTRGIVEEVLT